MSLLSVVRYFLLLNQLRACDIFTCYNWVGFSNMKGCSTSGVGVPVPSHAP